MHYRIAMYNNISTASTIPSNASINGSPRETPVSQDYGILTFCKSYISINFINNLIIYYVETANCEHRIPPSKTLENDPLMKTFLAATANQYATTEGQ